VRGSVPLSKIVGGGVRTPVPPKVTPLRLCIHWPHLTCRRVRHRQQVQRQQHLIQPCLLSSGYIETLSPLADEAEHFLTEIGRRAIRGKLLFCINEFLLQFSASTPYRLPSQLVENFRVSIITIPDTDTTHS